MNKVVFSKGSDEWETPDYLFNALNEFYEFDCDVAASDTNKKCKKYFSKEEDGLVQNWQGKTCWMNPPYSKVNFWVKKAHEEALNNATTVALLAARTDTRWFHDFVYNKHEIFFIKGRIKFKGAKGSAPFPSMIVFFGKYNGACI
jgi:phage N-6-adenine-methyltransferase